MENPWRTAGLLSNRTLDERLPRSPLWTGETETNLVFVQAGELLKTNLAGLRKGDEEGGEARNVRYMTCSVIASYLQGQA